MWKLPCALRISKCAAIAIALSAALPEPAAATAPLPPVLLIHGIKETARAMEPLARHLRAHGRVVYTMSLEPNWGQHGLEPLAGQVADFADKTFAAEERFDLVGFSMGGLVARYYVQRLGGLERVHRFVTVSSPHQGTALARLLPNAGGREMRPGSAFLRDLDSDVESLQRVGFTSLWTPLDLTILPARSSLVAGAANRRILCLAHGLMIHLPACQKAIRLALE